MAKVSIKDVAARAGVSFQTVGKVLNGKGAVSAETRQRILLAAEELGYVRNTLARGLRSTRTLTLGVLTVHFAHQGPGEYLVGIQREARRHDLSVIVTSAANDARDAEHNYRTLVEHRVDGLIVNAPSLEADRHFAELLAGGPPTVTLHELWGNPTSRVTGSGQTGSLPVDHLVRLGHRRVAMIGGIPDGRLTILRREAYRRILAEHGVEHDAALEDYGGWHVAGGAAAMARILDRRPETTAVYVQNDQMAIGALRTLHDRGVTVPRDFSLIGCDDLPFSAYTVPSLSTVRIPFAEIGEAAVRAVLAHIDDRDAEPRETVLPVDLVIRESTGPAPR